MLSNVPLALQRSALVVVSNTTISFSMHLNFIIQNSALFFILEFQTIAIDLKNRINYNLWHLSFHKKLNKGQAYNYTKGYTPARLTCQLGLRPRPPPPSQPPPSPSLHLRHCIEVEALILVENGI